MTNMINKGSFQKLIMKEANREAFFSISFNNPKTKYDILYDANKFDSNEPDNLTWEFTDLEK